jgi:hypothetical protein
MVAGFDESSTRSTNIDSTVFEKCIIKLALADTEGKFRQREGGGVMCEAVGVKHESTLVRSRSPCFFV